MLPIRIQEKASWDVPVRTMTMEQFYGQDDRRVYPDKMVVITDDNEKRLFNVVSKDFHLVTHKEILDQTSLALQNVIQKTINPKIICPERKAYYQGASIRASYELKDILPVVEVDRKVGDSVGFNFDLYNSYNGRYPLKGELSSLRLKCLNGAVVRTAWSTISARHFGSMSAVSNLEMRFTQIFERIGELKTIWQDWMTTPVGFDDPITQKLIESFSKKQIRQLGLNEGMKTRSKWDLWNDCTQLVTYGVRANLRRIFLDHELAKVFYN